MADPLDALRQRDLDRLGKFEQTQEIADRRPAHAQLLAQLLDRRAELVEVTLEGPGLLDVIEILPLEVLLERQLAGRLVDDVDDPARDLAQTGEARGLPAAFSRDQLKAAAG